MKTKLLKIFREEFNQELSIKLVWGSTTQYVAFKTPYLKCTLTRYILDAINSCSRDLKRDEILQKLYKTASDKVFEDYYEFMNSKIREYKEMHPYRGFKIKIIRTKRRK